MTPEHLRIESQVLNDALASVYLPVQRFLETGFYRGPFCDEEIPEHLRTWERMISDTQTRRICRAVAREQKRPFIQLYESWSKTEMAATDEKNEYGNPIYKYQTLPEPRFNYVAVVVPKRKYTMPLVTPLLLVAPDQADWRPGTRPLVSSFRMHSYWKFQIYDLDFWREYSAAFDRPEMRAARRLPPL